MNDTYVTRSFNMISKYRIVIDKIHRHCYLVHKDPINHLSFIYKHGYMGHDNDNIMIGHIVDSCSVQNSEIFKNELDEYNWNLLQQQIFENF